MKVSVVIPTKNGRKYIKNCLDGITVQKTGMECEIIVIDSGSTDGTLQILREYAVKLYTIPPESFSHSKTRNLGVSLATGDYIVYLSQDAVPVNDIWIEALVSPLVKDASVGAVFGRQVPTEDANPVNRFRVNWIYGTESSIKQKEDNGKFSRRSFNFSDVNAAVRKELLLKFPLDEDILFCEDIYLAKQLLDVGYKIVYSADAAVFHSHNHGILEIFRRYFDIAVAYRKIGILEKSKNIENEGKRYILEELKYLVRTGRSLWLLYAVICDTLKYAGFKAGCSERFLPLFLKKRLSNYWYR